jgi:hypothetical protein
MTFAWDESEKGRFSDEWFEPVRVPTIEHVPWVVKNMRIPPGMFDEAIRILKDKINSGAYEPSMSSYRSAWFFVLKKDGKSLRLVHDLQPLNAVTIKDASLPPLIEEIAEDFGGRGCYGGLDLFAAFDQCPLDVKSRDLLTFQTPIGALRPTMVPMGYTNAMQIMQGHVTHIFQPEIPEFTQPFVAGATYRPLIFRLLPAPHRTCITALRPRHLSPTPQLPCLCRAKSCHATSASCHVSVMSVPCHMHSGPVKLHNPAVTEGSLHFRPLLRPSSVFSLFLCLCIT